LKKRNHAQQVPKPPAPEPGHEPGNIPPPPPSEIPVSDPAPPPIENPGDVPLPPITDPDVTEPGKPNPAHTPTRDYGEHENRNLFTTPELENISMDAGLANPANSGDDNPHATVNDSSQRKWRIGVANIKPVDEATQDFTADLSALRDDVAKLTSSVSDFIRSQTVATTNTVTDAVDNARQKFSETASKAQDRVAGASSDIEETIERNPLVAVLVALVAGILVGLLSRGRK
jgi:ElaB/YqjD/DUF883 family membrane-anchored ribosome-binding protein